jgi:hypothetical protein
VHLRSGSKEGCRCKHRPRLGACFRRGRCCGVVILQGSRGSCAAIFIEAMRRVSEMLRQTDTARRGADVSGRGSQRSDDRTSEKTLSDYGISKQEMSEWRKTPPLLVAMAGGKPRPRREQALSRIAHRRRLTRWPGSGGRKRRIEGKTRGHGDTANINRPAKVERKGMQDETKYQLPKFHYPARRSSQGPAPNAEGPGTDPRAAVTEAPQCEEIGANATAGLR